jgi:hypothetical protein
MGFEVFIAIKILQSGWQNQFFKELSLICTLNRQAVCSSETLVPTYRTVDLKQDDHSVNLHHCENLKCHILSMYMYIIVALNNHYTVILILSEEISFQN